jgi:hypothetical protein
MSIKLIDGLADLSKQLGETTTNQTSPRIRHYNDAVQAFFAEKKWSFSTKKDESLVTVANQNRYSLDGITDIRTPGGIKEVQVGADANDNPAYVPIDYEQRHAQQFQGQKYFYIDVETNDIVFLSNISQNDLTITIRYYFIPERIEDLASSDEFPCPDKFRKIIATLAAAYVQWSRYLDAQGNRLFNMYDRLLNKTSFQQEERNRNNPRKMEHPLRWRGFRHTYPNGSRTR